MTSPDTTVRDNPDLTAGLAELADHAPNYIRADQYYRAEQPEFFASAKMRRALQRTGIGFRFNFARTPVDSVADRLSVAAITTQDEHATELIQQAWQANGLDLDVPHWVRETCKYGDGYIMAWPNADDDGRVDIYFNNPETTRIIYDDANPRVKRYAIKRWRTNEGHRCDLLYPDRIERYITAGGRGQTAAWHPYSGDGQTPTIPNPFGVVPVFHLRTDRPYGQPCHLGFYGPQDAINKLIISHLSSVDYQAFPQRYAVMNPETDTSEAAALDEDDFAVDPDHTDGPRQDDAASFRADPASVWMARGVKDFGQFDAADPKVFTDPVETYLRAGAQITTTPLHYFDPSGDAPSGESLRTAEAPFVKKCWHIALSFGAALRELFEFVLTTHGVTGLPVAVRWEPIATVDDQTGWETNQLKIDAGVPVRQVLLESGYSADQVDGWLSATDGMPFQVELLLKIGQALAQLGTAKNLGVVSDAQVQQLIDNIVTGAVNGEAA